MIREEKVAMLRRMHKEIKTAMERRLACAKCGDSDDVLYWNGYIEGIERCRRIIMEEMRKGSEADGEQWGLS